MRSTVSVLSLLVASATASYVLQDDYAASSFASMFDFFTVSHVPSIPLNFRLIRRREMIPHMDM